MRLRWTTTAAGLLAGVNVCLGDPIFGNLTEINCNLSGDPLDSSAMYNFLDLGNGNDFCSGTGYYQMNLDQPHCAAVRTDGMGLCYSLDPVSNPELWSTPPTWGMERAAAVFRARCPTYNDKAHATVRDINGYNYALLVMVKNATGNILCGNPSWNDINTRPYNFQTPWKKASNDFSWKVFPK